MAAVAENRKAQQAVDYQHFVSGVWWGTVGTQSEDGFADMSDMLNGISEQFAEDDGGERLTDEDQRAVLAQMFRQGEVTFIREQVTDGGVKG